MRADNNWEDNIGKRLHDFEGELSPEAWNNISRRIKPKRRWRLLWLPVMLLLVIIPGALFVSGTLELPETELTDIAQKKAVSEGFKSVNQTDVTNSHTPKANQNKTTEPENKQPVAGQKSTGKQENRTATVTEKPFDHTVGKHFSKPRKPILPVSISTTIRPAKPISAASEEKEKKNVTEKTAKTAKTQPIISSGRNQATGILASINSNKKPINASKSTPKPKPENATEIAAKTTRPSEETSISMDFEKGNGGKNNAGNTGELTKNPELISGEPVVAVNSKHKTVPGNTGLGKADSIAAIIKTAEAAGDSATKAKPEEKKKNTEKKPWIFTVYGAPQYTFQRVQPNRNDDLNILKLQNKNAFETERIGYEFGMCASYPIRQQLLLELGLKFAHFSQCIKYATPSQFADSAVVEQHGSSVTMQVYQRQVTEQVILKYYFAGLYTGLKVSVLEQLFLSGGFGVNGLLRANAEGNNSNMQATKINPYISAGLQYNFPLSDKLNVQVGPTMQYYLNPMQQKQAFMAVKPIVFGLSVGLQFKK